MHVVSCPSLKEYDKYVTEEKILEPGPALVTAFCKGRNELIFDAELHNLFVVFIQHYHEK